MCYGDDWNDREDCNDEPYQMKGGAKTDLDDLILLQSLDLFVHENDSVGEEMVNE